jgi:5'-nucleotidase
MPRDSRRLTVAGAAMVALSAASVGLAAPSTASAPSTAPAPLRIMLTNDDGYAAPGLVAVRDALRAAGHDVTVVAPLANQSGASGRATFGGALPVTRVDEDTFAVDGSPADATEVGLSVVFADKAPDLVVSGSNAGQNIAAATIHSGTVGAAVTAIEDGVPALAVSTELTTTAQPYQATGEFVARLVTALQERAHGGRLLEPGTGLNINYPVVEDGSEPRPALTETGRGFLDLTYTGALPAVGATTSLTVGVDLGVPEPVRGADSTALERNRIAVTVIEGDYDADRATAAREVERVLATLD